MQMMTSAEKFIITVSTTGCLSINLKKNTKSGLFACFLHAPVWIEQLLLQNLYFSLYNNIYYTVETVLTIMDVRVDG